MTIDSSKSIPAFYAGQSILLTGATGFLGKVFIEKILRSCPDVREIFLLTRPKKGLNINQRLEKMLNLPLYEKLREERPTNFEKLIPISGNVNEKELGLSTKDRQMLTERVTIIIHAAANVKFNITLKHAIFAHARATRDICNLAQSMKNLIALVYVSTAFAHVNKPIIEEKAYPPITDWQKMIKVAESLDEHTLNIFMAKYLDYIPNTYIFSKNLAESVVEEYSSSLPCAIVRPSIVTPSLKEPIPGWIDNIYGPIGLFIGGGKGVIRVACCNKYVNQDAVPVDIVIKAILVVSWKLGLTTFTGSTSYVLNCTNQKHLTYQDGIKLLFSVTDEIPLEGIICTRNTILTDNWILFYILTILLHILPAILIDLILKFFGRRSMLLRLQRKVYVVNRALSYFSFNEWKYSITNRLSLISSIPPDDQDMFSFDYSYNDIREYVKNSAIGGKKFLLHEDMNRLEAARAHAKSFVLKVINKMTVDSTKSIPAFYAGQSILLTGATGFLGKVFIEKVLRSCPDVREIFLLMRPKKGLNVTERLEKILNVPLYEKLREERPSNFEKLIPISGDVSKKELGLSAMDRKMLTERVTIIIHAAASVKFNNSLKYAILAHTRATRDICILAQNMKNLIALVYVGTAFAHVNKLLIEEKVYPSIADWQKMIEMAESLNEHSLNILTAKYLDFVPNTYIFSKNLAESVIEEYSSSLPCAIVRPSMVLSSLKEPIPGWIDNVYGTLGLYITGGKGILRVALCNKHVQVNVVPVDIVIKAIIVVSWKLGLTILTTNHIPLVLNCVSQRYITYQNDIETAFSVLNEVPLEGNIWTPNTILTDNFILFYILMILLHILPAMLIDLILKFSGRRPKMVQLQRQIYVATCVLSYFSLNQWKYSNTNSLDLISLIPPDNREIFSFDYFDHDIRKYRKNCIIGCKKYLLYEDMNRLDAAKAHSKRVYLFVTMVKSVISVGVLWVIYKWMYY